MLFAKIGNKRFISAAVSTVKIKYAKSIFKDGYYFEFPNNKEHYPLEFALTQFPALEKHDLVFIEDIDKKGFIGVFLKSLNRKSIFVEKQNFNKQLNKYENIFENIGIVNPSILLDNKSCTQLTIEKLPSLYDPAKNGLIAKRYLFLSVFTALLYVLTSSKIDDLNAVMDINKTSLEKEKVTFQQLFNSVKEKTLPELPSKETNESNLNKLIEKINNGEIK